MNEVLFKKIVVNSTLNNFDVLKYSGEINNRNILLYHIVGYFLYNELYSTNTEKDKLEQTLLLIQSKSKDICNIRELDNSYVNYETIIVIGDTNNTAPVVSGVSITGDTPLEFSNSSFTNAFSDVDNDSPNNIRIETLPASGSLYYNYDGESTLININDVFSTSDIYRIQYTQTISDSSDSFTFRINDDNQNPLYSNMATCTITIENPINQPPNQTGIFTTSLVMGKSYVFTKANFKDDTVPIYNDPESNDVYSVKITTLPPKTYGELTYSGTAVSTGQEIDIDDIVSGMLMYTSFILTDGGAYADGFNFSISDTGSKEFRTGGSVVINISAYTNLPPEIGDAEETIDEGELLTITRAMLTTETVPPYFDYERNPALNLKITTLESAGSLKLDGVDVTLNQEISFADIDLNKLKYSPAGSAGGTTATFDFEIEDSGSGGYSG